MNFRNFLRQIILSLLAIATGIMSSCEHLHEDLPECRLFVKFKYDYNMLSADAFSSQVDKVDLYVFDKDGKFLFKQTGEGAPLTSGTYRMEVKLPVGKYQFMAWAGVHDSYDITSLQPGVSSIEDLKLKLKRDVSLIIDKDLEPLWYGEIIDVDFTGTINQTETINLIKDTKTVRFIFQSYQAESWTLNVDDYEYEIIESNGYLNYDNSLLPDDILSYRPYYTEQRNASTIIVELNTMRLMADRSTRFVVTEKATGTKVFDINLIEYLAMTKMEGHKWGEQEYLDRQDEYSIIFSFGGEPWVAVELVINGWTCYIQTEEGS